MPCTTRVAASAPGGVASSRYGRSCSGLSVNLPSASLSHPPESESFLAHTSSRQNSPQPATGLPTSSTSLPRRDGGVSSTQSSSTTCPSAPRSATRLLPCAPPWTTTSNSPVQTFSTRNV